MSNEIRRKIRENFVKILQLNLIMHDYKKKKSEFFSSSKNNYQELHVNNLESVETTNRNSTKNGQFPIAVTLLPSLTP